MALIKVEQLTKTYHSTAVPVHALQNVNLTFERGEFSAVVGPSGSGKTTFLNMLGGLDKPTSGQIFIDGRNLAELKGSALTEYRLHHIGFVFQAYNLIPVFSALENVEFIMLLQGVGKKERRKRAQALLEAVGLGDRLHSRPTQLSGGQQQRVAVARALASRPEFVLADEPTANLDSHSAAELLSLMENLNKQFNMTFIFSTHDVRVIQRARRVITLHDGKVEKDEIIK